jgi:hypothetical protein
VPKAILQAPMMDAPLAKQKIEVMDTRNLVIHRRRFRVWSVGIRCAGGHDRIEA